MKKLLLAFMVIFLIPSFAGAEIPKSTLDSLWIRASSGEIRFRDEVQPSKDALIELGSDAVDYLVEKMDTRSAREMHTLVDLLGKIGKPAVAKVCEQLESGDNFRIVLACRILGKIKDTSAIVYLLPHAEDSLYNIRSGVASALGEIGDASASATLVQLAKDSDYLVRKSATVSLGKMPYSEAIDVLIDNLSDDYYGVRYSAATSLIKFGDKSKKALEGYITELVNGDFSELPSTRIFGVALALDCLGKIGDKGFSKDIKKIIKSKNDSVIRGYAVLSLKQIGGKSNLRFLKKIAKKEKDIFVNALLSDIINR